MCRQEQGLHTQTDWANGLHVFLTIIMRMIVKLSKNYLGSVSSAAKLK